MRSAFAFEALALVAFLAFASTFSSGHTVAPRWPGIPEIGDVGLGPREAPGEPCILEGDSVGVCLSLTSGRHRRNRGTRRIGPLGVVGNSLVGDSLGDGKGARPHIMHRWQWRRRPLVPLLLLRPLALRAHF